jgi:hypothetical protein
MTRELRDLLAEALWREPGIAFTRKQWAVWDKLAPDETEAVRRRADHLMRLLAELGLTLVRTGQETPSLPPPSSPVVWRYRLFGAATERMVRKGHGDQWQIVIVDGHERVEHAFTMAEAHEHAGMVLMGDPEAKKVANLGKELSAALEIFRVDAAAMEAPQGKAEAAE